MVFIISSFYTTLDSTGRERHRYEDDEFQTDTAADAVRQAEEAIRARQATIKRACTFIGTEVSCSDGENDIYAVARVML